MSQEDDPSQRVQCGQSWNVASAELSGKHTLLPQAETRYESDLDYCQEMTALNSGGELCRYITELSYLDTLPAPAPTQMSLSEYACDATIILSIISEVLCT